MAIGNTRVITPAGKSWEEWFDGRGCDDFMVAREQPRDQEREAFWPGDFLVLQTTKACISRPLSFA